MDSFSIAMIIAAISPAVGCFMFLVKKPDYKRNNAKKYKVHICNILFVIGIIIYVSFLLCISKGVHHNSSVKHTEYPIEKLTFDNVYFNGREGYSFNESYVILENPSDKYENVVVAETEYFTLNWLFKIKTSSSKYHVYLSKDVFNRFQDGNTIYRSEQ